MERHVLREPGLLDVPESEAVEARVLERVDDDVTARAVLPERLGDEEGRHAVCESGLQAQRGAVCTHQLEEILAASGVDSRRHHPIAAPVAVHDLPLAKQPFENRVDHEGGALGVTGCR